MNEVQALGDQWFAEAFAGFAAGVATTVSLHPLDLLKLRLQIDRSNWGRRGGSLRIIRGIFNNEGGLRAFYRGFTPNLLGNSSSWALYFMWYDMSKSLISTAYGQNTLSYYDFFVASTLAGLGTAICTNPIWVIKTRMLSTAKDHRRAYKSITEGARLIYYNEGITGFYRGITPSLFGVVHGALQFMAYEKLKQFRLDTSPRSKGALSNWDFLVFSGISKAFAGTVTYPYQVIRSRLQTYDADKLYSSLRDAASQINRQEGVLGFYKGLGPNLLRIIPSSCITFLVYENTKIAIQTIQ